MWAIVRRSVKIIVISTSAAKGGGGAMLLVTVRAGTTFGPLFRLRAYCQSVRAATPAQYWYFYLLLLAIIQF